MNLTEAIKSCQKFKRELWANWYTMTDLYKGKLNLVPLDILADDWVVQKNTVTITSDDFAAAIQRVTNTLGTGPHMNARISEYIFELQKELGL